tara:strand:- start:168 stop:704 length:537 start_codon:yes stop_codon:yes gene_type:complete
MKILKQFFNHCFIFSVKKFSDKRGYFSEIFNELVIKNNFKKKFKCKQVNFVYSKRNSLRGIHLQKKPKSQIKIIRVIDGKILDVIVDLRKKSPTFGKYKKFILSSQNKRQIYIPEGFGHGYLTLSKTAKVVYFCSENYHKSSEITLNVFDKQINILWGLNQPPKISKKDKIGIGLMDY